MAENKIQAIHDAVLDFLLEKRKDNPTLNFTLRRSNRFNRLENGHWFYGNENYLALSFWTGMDWKNKTPNIIFSITPEGKSYLEFVASDSEEKKTFFIEEIPNWISNLKRTAKGVYKEFERHRNNYIESLETFISTEKIEIDRAVEEKASLFLAYSDDFNRIGFIDQKEFERRLTTILRYRNERLLSTPNRLPNALGSIQIRNLGPIKNLVLEDIPETTKWVVLTGLNGKGKSSILKAIAIGLCGNSDRGTRIKETGDFEITTTVKIGGRAVTSKIETRSDYKSQLLVDAFASYGSSRQMLDFDDGTESQYSTKSGLTYNLFHNDGLLLDLETQLKKLQIYTDRPPHLINADERISQIVEILPEIIPTLVAINLPTKQNRLTQTIYVEEDHLGNKLPPVVFEDLASGLKSLVAMLGDMMSRLFAQQPEITDPSELRGIVIIDEIDIHLHPTLQKRLPELLDGIFSKVQFIVSTHSPIPLLGVPPSTKIFRVERDHERGVFIDEIKVDLPNLLPNALLTSPIFGMDELRPSSNKDVKKIVVDDHYDEKEFFELVRKKNEELSNKLSNNEESQ